MDSERLFLDERGLGNGQKKSARFPYVPFA